MDELLINTTFAKSLLGRLAQRVIRKKLKRSIEIHIDQLSMVHKENSMVDVRLKIVASMSEAELDALLEQLSGK